jgi:hypothetical protein
VTHVEDPNTSARDLASAFLALERLGQRNAAPAIERFVRLHHAEPAGSELAPALASALHALGALKARPAKPTLEQVAQDGFSAAPVRDAAFAALKAMAEDANAKPQVVQEEPEEEEEEVQTDPRPYSIGADAVRKALAPLRNELTRCVANDASKPRSGRMSIVVDATGHVEGVFVTPSTLSPCVEPVVRRAQFPATRLGRQRVTQVLHGASATRASLRAAKTPSAKPAGTKPAPAKGVGAKAAGPAPKPAAKPAPKP